MTASDPVRGAAALEVVCAAAGIVLQVPPGSSVLDAVRAAGLEVPPPCRDRRCGACETRVLGGEPDHRDGVLTAEERAVGETMMICVSGARSARGAGPLSSATREGPSTTDDVGSPCADGPGVVTEGGSRARPRGLP